MKIRVWLFSVIVAGALVLGAAGGYMLSQGFSLVNLLAQNVKAALDRGRPGVQILVPPGQGGNWRQDGGWSQGGSDGGQYEVPRGGWQEQAGEDALPADFNAGVSIPGTYGEMTGRTEEQVLAEAEKAGADIFALAKKEGKLEELKTKLRERVTASLDKMVGEGKITKGQKETYLQRVELILQMADQTDGGASFLPNRQGSGGKPDA